MAYELRIPQSEIEPALVAEVVRLQARVKEVMTWNEDRMVHSTRIHTVGLLRSRGAIMAGPLKTWIVDYKERIDYYVQDYNEGERLEKDKVRAIKRLKMLRDWHDKGIKDRYSAILEYLTIARREGFGTY